MIPYYNPHFSIFDLFRSFFLFRTERRIIEFFKSYTGKKYILFTSSCRASLYLTYMATNLQGKVIVSPLTCQSAIDPMIWAGNNPLFKDINIESLNIDTNLVTEQADFKGVVAVQVINHGGLKVENEIREFANKNKLLIIDDCAQSFGTVAQILPQSDVLCFSLIKTAYGLGGGILATDNKEIYTKAKNTQKTFPSFSKKVVLFRIIKQLLETHQRIGFIHVLYQKLIMFRLQTIKESDSLENVKTTYLKKPSVIFKKYFATRIGRLKKMQNKRNEKGRIFYEKLLKNELADNYSLTDLKSSSFTKLFIYHPSIEAEQLIGELNNQGIEAKHLEHRADHRTQARFDQSEISKYSEGISQCDNYLKVHDHLVSLPVIEEMSEDDMEMIIGIMKANMKPSVL